MGRVPIALPWPPRRTGPESVRYAPGLKCQGSPRPYSAIAHARLRLQAAQEFIGECGPLLGLGILELGQLDVRFHDVGDAEAGVHGGEGSEAAKENAGSDEEHHGQGDLGGSEKTAGEAASARFARMGGAFFESGLHVGPYGKKSGRESEEQAGEKRKRQSKEQNGRVDANGMDLRKVLGEE